MASNLAAAGLDVRVYNRTPEKAEALADKARVCDTPAEAARGADAVITMLTDGNAVEEVMTGPGGALEVLDTGAVWLQMSTVGIKAADKLAGLAHEAEVAFVDAPVLGTKEPAQRGQLLVIASGPKDEIERCARVFDAIGSEVHVLGAAGQSSAMKVVVNNWLLTLVEGLAETVTLAESLDLDPSDFLAIIDGGPVGAPYAQLKGKAMIDESFEPSFPLSLALKDVGLVIAAGEQAGHEVTLGRVIARQLERAVNMGHGDEDMAAAYYASKP